MGWERANHQDKGPKVAVIGPTGSLKTRTFLRAGHRDDGPPRLLLLDYEDGADHYDDEFNFAREKIHQVMRLDDPELAITREEIQDLRADRNVYKPLLDRGQVYGVDFASVTLLGRIARNPIDFVCVDSISMHYQWVMDKWLDIFLKREADSPGNRRDYYTMQPRDYDKPYRDVQQFICRLKAEGAGVFMTTQEKPEYAEGEFMKKIGMTHDAHKRLPYLMDTVVHVEPEETGKATSAEKRHTRFVAVVRKDRTNRLSDRFVWANHEDGFSKTFITLFGDLLGWEGKQADLDAATPPMETDGASSQAESKTPEADQPSSAPCPSNDGKVTRPQLMKLKWLKQYLAVPDDRWKGVLAKRDVTTARDLTFSQADDLIETLYGKLNLAARVVEADEAFKIIEEGGDPFRPFRGEGA